MNNGTLILFQWSLRADSRAFWPHAVRAGFALLMMAGIVVVLADPFGTTGPGLLYFQQICRLNMVLIFAAGITYFVSAVSEEKDSGTLALLRLAGVTPLAILLGKSTSRLISSLMLLAIQLPFTLLSITLGGVTWKQVIAAYLALAAWMALVANLALFCSVRCQTMGRAATLTVLLLVLLMILSPLIQLALPTLQAVSTPAWMLGFFESLRSWVEDSLINRRLTEILSPAGQSTELLGAQFFWNSLMSLVLFGMSVLVYNRWSLGSEQSVSGDLRSIRLKSHGRCWKWAVVWKDFLFLTGGRTAVAGKLIGYGLLVAGCSWWHHVNAPLSRMLLDGDTAWITLILLALALCVEVLLFSAGSLFSEVRQTTLSTLQMVPISTPILLLQKVCATVLAVMPAGLWMVVVFFMAPQAVMERCSITMVISYILVVMLSSHLTVLLSLYARWAALPLAILITATSFMCCPMVIMGTLAMTESVARQHNIQVGLLLGGLINLLWVWVFILLPIELEIVKRWDRLGQES
ncbi:MAG: hypothetical protein JNL58_03455 [Planctomyces sp.]|nr:hypothetical protein [Planctomyces sp.]